jgi:hypothetical protein
LQFSGHIPRPDSKSEVVAAALRKPKRLAVSFSVPKARQADVVDGIARPFWHCIEDYNDSSIGFAPEPRQKASRSLAK